MNNSFKIKKINDTRYYTERYVVVDKDTGELVYDCDGYGFKSVDRAMRAFAFRINENLVADPENRNFEVKLSPELTMRNSLYGIFNSETGELVDDFFGYGFKSTTSGIINYRLLNFNRHESYNPYGYLDKLSLEERELENKYLEKYQLSYWYQVRSLLNFIMKKQSVYESDAVRICMSVFNSKYHLEEVDYDCFMAFVKKQYKVLNNKKRRSVASK